MRKALWIGALASGMTLLASIGGLAQGSAVSQEPSPLASCDNGTQTGRNYVSAEVEPQLAVSGKNMIAQWHQDRWSNGGGHGIGVGVSSNGGASWADFGASRCKSLPKDAFCPRRPARAALAGLESARELRPDCGRQRARRDCMDR